MVWPWGPALKEIGEFLAECDLLGQPQQQQLIELRVEKTGGKRVFSAARLHPLAIVQLQDGMERQQPILDLYVVGHHRDAENQLGKPARDRLQQRPGFLTLKGAGVSLGPKCRKAVESPFNLADMLKRLGVGEVACSRGSLECANGVIGSEASCHHLRACAFRSTGDERVRRGRLVVQGDDSEGACGCDEVLQRIHGLDVAVGAQASDNDGRPEDNQCHERHEGHQVQETTEGQPVHNTSTAPRGAPTGQFGGNLATASENFFNIGPSPRRVPAKNQEMTEGTTETTNDFGEKHAPRH